MPLYDPMGMLINNFITYYKIKNYFKYPVVENASRNNKFIFFMAVTAVIQSTILAIFTSSKRILNIYKYGNKWYINNYFKGYLIVEKSPGDNSFPQPAHLKFWSLGAVIGWMLKKSLFLCANWSPASLPFLAFFVGLTGLAFLAAAALCLSLSFFSASLSTLAFACCSLSLLSFLFPLPEGEDIEEVEVAVVVVVVVVVVEGEFEDSPSSSGGMVRGSLRWSSPATRSLRLLVADLRIFLGSYTHKRCLKCILNINKNKPKEKDTIVIWIFGFNDFQILEVHRDVWQRWNLLINYILVIIFIIH